MNTYRTVGGAKGLNIMKATQNWTLACCLIGGLVLTQPLHAQITVTAEGVGAQSSDVPGITTETFDEFATPPSSGTPIGTTLATGYVSPIGTFVGGSVFAANEYGGAGGSGNFLGIGNEQGDITSIPAYLYFSRPQSYVGLWWSAADSENVLSFYNGSTLLGSFTEASLTSTLGSLGAYNGNPNGTSEDPSQPFIYLNFTDAGGPTITSVEFNNGTGTAFELDNISILTAASPVPEASSTLVLFGMGLGVLGMFARRIKK